MTNSHPQPTPSAPRSADANFAAPEDLVYLDHAAATPVTPRALSAMQPYFSAEFFNPSAPYLPAKHVRLAYESAKDQLAHIIGAKGSDLIITSGSTESINLAFTALRAYPSARLLTLSTEHAAVLSAAKAYPHQTIRVQPSGLINLADFRAQLTDDVALVSIALVNNELGTIQPFSEISEIIRSARESRLRQGIKLPLFLHSDASQALTLLDLNVARLGVDLLTISAAKCGGPKGVGALYVAHHVPLQPLVAGGGQEHGLRSGTENVPGVIGFAVAASEAKSHLAYHRKEYQKMAQILRKAIKNLAEVSSDTSIVAQNSEKVKHKLHSSALSDSKTAHFQIPEPLFLGDSKHQLTSFVPVCFPGLDAERLIYKLEAEGILVSTGAACAASRGSKSHVLTAIGLSDSEIAGSLRISLGPTNTEEQIAAAAPKIATIVRNEYLRLAERSSK